MSESDILKRMKDVAWQVVLADDALGYPKKVDFVPADSPTVDQDVWDLLVNERRAVAVVDIDDEMIIVPRHRTLLDRIREVVPVTIEIRTKASTAGKSFNTELGRKPVSSMRTAIAA